MSYPTITNSTVLVTGGAGFIGCNLCGDLLKYNNRVICLDNFSTGKKDNTGSLLKQRNFTLIEGDIRHPADCSRAMKGVNIVLHQAALGSVPRSLKDPVTTNEVNVNGFLNVLSAARDEKVKRLVYASSSSAYGDSAALPKVEDVTGKPLSPYAVTKQANELYAHVFGLNYGMEIIGLRYFNVYGPHQDPEGAYAAAIPKFTKLLMSHQSPVINGDGTNSRDFTYIDNIIQINHLAATTNNPSAPGQTFNAAVGESATMNELTALLKEYLGKYDEAIKNVPVNYGPERPGDIPHSLASVKKANEVLGYKPQTDLRNGLEKAVKWYWENLR
jgi:UDP-N-acetylglucosamine/UDP-N-acetylgalactosamine 4-epimerase